MRPMITIRISGITDRLADMMRELVKYPMSFDYASNKNTVRLKFRNPRRIDEVKVLARSYGLKYTTRYEY